MCVLLPTLHEICCVYLPWQSLTAGTLVLGAVQEIGKLEITVSLPNNMCGVVAISNVSDPLTEGMENELEEGGGGEEGGGESEVRECVTASNLTCVLYTASRFYRVLLGWVDCSSLASS